MRLRTEICDLTGIEYPIFQGGMARVSTAELAAAVSNAGGLGIIGAAAMDAETLRSEIKKTREMTDKPFGVNIYLISPVVDELMKVVIEEKVKVVTTGAGNPGKYVPELKEAGIVVVPVVASVALAKRLVRDGADAVIAEGTESGGHIGEIGTMALVPQIVDAVGDKVPVIAAGGIADGRGIVAAFALGAKGVQLGTVFVATEECIVHDNYKNAIVKAGDRDTVVTGRSTGHPVRALRNKFTRQYLELEKSGASPEELDEFGRGSLRRAVEGDVANGTVMMGQISGLIKEVRPVKEVVDFLVKDTLRVMEEMKKLYESWK